MTQHGVSTLCSEEDNSGRILGNGRVRVDKSSPPVTEIVEPLRVRRQTPIQ